LFWNLDFSCTIYSIVFDNAPFHQPFLGNYLWLCVIEKKCFVQVLLSRFISVTWLSLPPWALFEVLLIMRTPTSHMVLYTQCLILLLPSTRIARHGDRGHIIELWETPELWGIGSSSLIWPRWVSLEPASWHASPKQRVCASVVVHVAYLKPPH
jgi:hypothetical protein